jgi:uncharacterized membrane protein
MKRSFFAGLAILLPFVITLIIIAFLFNLFTEPFTKTIKAVLDRFFQDPVMLIEHEKLLLFFGKIVALLVLFFFIILLGWAARKFFIKWILQQIHHFIMKIPYLKRLYKIVDQVISSFIPAEKEEIFKATVLIKFPHLQSDVIGLLAGDAPIVAQRALNEDELRTVFVPTAPHPVSGFLLMTAAKNFKKIDMSTEQAIKYLLSCGIVHPGEDDEKGE